MPVGKVMRSRTDTNLFEVVCTLHPPGGLPRTLHRRQQKAYENADDGDHHQEFHQGKTVSSFHVFLRFFARHPTTDAAPAGLGTG